MYPVFFSDLEKVLCQLKKKLPNLMTFCSIQGNANGDFVIKDGTNTYIVIHTGFSVWRLEGDWRNGKWVEIE